MPKEAVRWLLLLCALTCGLTGRVLAASDSVPAAITVYRNPEFFRNATTERGESEDLEKEEGDGEDGYSEDFYDFDDDYRYPGEPTKPNPPAAPDFTTYYDESPEFQPPERDPAPVREDDSEVEHSQENELSEESDSSEQEEEEEDESNREESPPAATPRYPPADKYRVQLDEDLKPRTPPKVYDYSKQYYNPIFDEGIKSFAYPSSYEDLDFYEYHEKRPAPVTDRKKGTREYLRDHSDEEVVEEPPPRSGNHCADSKLVFKAVSKFGVHAFKPVLYVPHKVKSKHKYWVKPRKLKWRLVREVPDDSAYELSSDYDSDFEFL